MPLQIRRGTNAERLSLTPTTGLVEGEIIYVTDEQRLYIGTGRPGEHRGVPVTNITFDDAKDAAGVAITSGIHQNITFEYDEINSVINSTVDLSNYQGLIRADALRGSLFADDSSLLVNAETGEFNGTLVGLHIGEMKGSVFADNSTLLVNGVDGTFNLEGTIKGDVYPNISEVYDLGSATARFKDLYLSGSTIYLGSAQITSTGSAINLPIGSTVGGNPIGSGGAGDGFIPGSNYNINIVGDDSSLIVDSSSGRLRGNLIGQVLAYDQVTVLVDAGTATFNGQLVGNSQGTHTGNVNGSILSSDGSSILLNNVSETFTGTVNGTVNGNLVGNSQGDHVGNVNGSILSSDGSSILLNNVSETFNGTVNGTVNGTLIGNSQGDHVGNVTGSIYASDGVTVLLNNISETFNGTVNGTVNGTLIGNSQGYHYGDVTGSLFGADSSRIVDGTDGSINTNRITHVSGILNVGTNSQSTALHVSSNQNEIQILRGITQSGVGPGLFLHSSNGTINNPTSLTAGDEVGGFTIRAFDGSIYKSTSAFLSILDSSAVMSDDNPLSNIFLAPAAGGANFSIYQFKGDGTFVAPGPVQLAVYADDAARNAAIPMPVQGMMVFMQSGTVPTVTNKTVVYDGTAWTTLA